MAERGAEQSHLRAADGPPVSPQDLPPDLPTIVGTNLRRLRRRQGHSLERLAALSGVSRAMLGQIETGKSVPTISVLWKIANALNVPFAQFLADSQNCGLVIQRRGQAKLLSSSDGKYVSRALFSLDMERKTEFYELRLAPLHKETADGRVAGTRENLVVARGTVEVFAGKEAPVTLAEGDAIVFAADTPHSYRNLGQSEAVLYVVICYVEGLR